MRKLINPLLLCLAVLCLQSCVSKKKFGQLMTDKEAIDQMLADQQDRVANLEGDLNALQDEKANLEQNFNTETSRLNGELSQMQSDLKASKEEIEIVKKTVEEKDMALKAVQDKLNTTFGVYSKSGLNIAKKNSALYVETSAPIRYVSGSTRISEEAKLMLAEMAQSLISNPTIKIMVEGHTDSVPLKEGAVYKDNMELSKARANRVVNELVALGVSPNQLSSVGRGESMPTILDETNSEEANSMNRRTEFVVVPAVGDLYDLNSNVETSADVESE